MKYQHSFFCIPSLIVLIMIFYNGYLSGQALDKKKSVDFMHIAKTSDVLYINDSTYFLMNKSPLEKFPNYKNLYDHFKKYFLSHVDVIYGTAIRPDETTNYHVVWYLNDSSLYMSDINFFSIDKIENIFPNNEQYKLMEKLTGVNFDTKYGRSITHTLINSFGAMPATWYSDTIMVKQAAKYGTNLSKWRKIPCRELIFRHGKLISDHIKEGIY